MSFYQDMKYNNSKQSLRKMRLNILVPTTSILKLHCLTILFSLFSACYRSYQKTTRWNYTMSAFAKKQIPPKGSSRELLDVWHLKSSVSSWMISRQTSTALESCYGRSGLDNEHLMMIIHTTINFSSTWLLEGVVQENTDGGGRLHPSGKSSWKSAGMEIQKNVRQQRNVNK